MAVLSVGLEAPADSQALAEMFGIALDRHNFAQTDAFTPICSSREAGLNPYLVEMAKIRNQNSWVHQKMPEKATAKAKDQLRPAFADPSGGPAAGPERRFHPVRRLP